MVAELPKHASRPVQEFTREGESAATSRKAPKSVTTFRVVTVRSKKSARRLKACLRPLIIAMADSGLLSPTSTLHALRFCKTPFEARCSY